jgi:hypothetical protein
MNILGMITERIDTGRIWTGRISTARITTNRMNVSRMAPGKTLRDITWIGRRERSNINGK